MFHGTHGGGGGDGGGGGRGGVGGGRSGEGSSFPLSIAGINLSQLLLRHLGADAETLACNPADSRWDSELFLFLCRAAVRQHERGENQRGDAAQHERSGGVPPLAATPAAAAELEPAQKHNCQLMFSFCKNFG